ncbi:GAF domain-containing protein [Pseudomonas sp. CFBP 13711]|uniref:ATP-binding protein n=1 Tax=unclassified Pseudomonas TaxID=196821 RepID=UPI001786978F|nr:MULTISPECIES: ATP-binding protein [unclassified Pseudomonas]MBD8710220.1 GAF domain-containing protein [Pseudomonas sp. CFBP 13711]MBD8715507.1 GAF domain-containing protein [Pseudomonas sp. CFBP 13715]
MNDAFQQAMATCAQEPIRTPGSIQPQGFLAVIAEPEMTILQVSENLTHWLEMNVDQLIGSHLGALVSNGAELVKELGELDEDESQPYHVADVSFLMGNRKDRRVAMMLHRHDGMLIAEFERPGETEVVHSRLYPLVRSFITQTKDAESVDDICVRAVRVIKRLTGFGRVKSYRFDSDGNGLVNAELLDAGYPSYLGLCFPASDIPKQARELYCANRIRVIEDVDYVPSPVIPTLNPKTGAPLDLSYAALRSVSPVHLQYMRNMRTLSSMSISIVVDGRLWGLVSCHHDSPHQVNFQTRTACELLGRVLSLQVETREAHIQSARMLLLRQNVVQMLAAMADHDSVLQGLRALPDIFVNFVGASGAAVVSGAGCDLYGNTPAKADVLDLTEWLSCHTGSEVFHSDNIRRDIPELPRLADSVSGVLAVAISEIHSNYLIWFKPEQSHVVHWAGQPQKTLDETGALNPRQSFEHWQQLVEGFSTPWDASEVEGVSEFRFAVLGIVLRKAEELAEVSEELKRSNKELESFSYSVSHDLRAPLRHIAGYTDLLSDLESSNMTERGHRFLGTIANSAKFAGTLVDNLLTFSQMGRSTMKLKEVNLLAMLDSIRHEMRPDYENRSIEWRVGDLPNVIADPAFLHLAMRNLVANAIKYTRDRLEGLIEVRVQDQPDEFVVSVHDNGVGFDMQYAGKLFGVFQRLHRMEEFEGTGIGLANVKRIVERHDGTVWAEGRLDKGASFYFTLPKKNLSSTADVTLDL